jgi:hypothetical protein
MAVDPLRPPLRIWNFHSTAVPVAYPSFRRPRPSWARRVALVKDKAEPCRDQSLRLLDTSEARPLDDISCEEFIFAGTAKPFASLLCCFEFIFQLLSSTLLTLKTLAVRNRGYERIESKRKIMEATIHGAREPWLELPWSSDLKPRRR